MPRKFEAAPAERKAQNLFIGLVGPSSSGKTYSALELATGIQSVCGGDIAVIDTENHRALAYADHFKFLHIPFEPPWGSLDYVAALQYAATKAKTIVVDSASHEHEGEGGMIDFQEHEVERMSRGDAGKAERIKMLAWAKPKAARRELLKAITRLDANVIMCFRAKNTSKPGKDEGKSVVIPMGFVPIAGEEFVFEMALSALFHPGSRGVPTWDPEFPGEKIAVKIPKQFEWLRESRGPMTREVGRKLAEWAQGGKAGAPASKPQTEQIDTDMLRQAAEATADRGADALAAHWKTLPQAHRDALKPYGADLRKRADSASTGQQAQTEGQSLPAVRPAMWTADGTTQFQTESEYLAAYEATVTRMYGSGDASALLKFDTQNKPHVEASGLAGAIGAINERVRRPAGGLDV